MNSKTVLVTGGAGYIGSHVCKALSRAGYIPVAFDNLSRGHRSLVKWGPFVEGDMSDRAKLDEVFISFRPMAVLHFAAFAYVGESVLNPEVYYRNNVLGSLFLLEAMKRHSVWKLVLSSTCNTYGIPQTLPISERHPQNPINPYGQSKLIVEKMLGDFDRAYGLRSISLRYFNAAGADIDGETGEMHDPETHLIPLVLDVAAGLAPAIKVFGDDYQTPDGTCIRDYIHVSDLADAHVLALAVLERGIGSDAINLGNGAGHSVMEVIGAAERVTQKKIAVELSPRREGDSDRLVSDSRKAFTKLGWRPNYTEIETILQHAWQWHNKIHAES